MENNLENKPCPVTTTLGLIGGRWKPLILFHLAEHTRRFGEIAVRMPKISRKVLSEQLKELEEDGLVYRQQFKEIPPRVEYSLTKLGVSVKPLLIQMAEWGQEMLLNKQSN